MTVSLIRCADGDMAPAVIVCRPRAGGTSREWIEVPTDGSEASDWLCPECFDKGPEVLTVDDLAAVCMHCARRMREEVDGAP